MNPKRRRELAARIDALEAHYAQVSVPTEQDVQIQFADTLIDAGRGRLEDYQLVCPDFVTSRHSTILYEASWARVQRRLFGRDSMHTPIAARVTSYLPVEPLPTRLIYEFHQAVTIERNSYRSRSEAFWSCLDRAIVGDYQGQVSRYEFAQNHDATFPALDRINDWTTDWAEYNRFRFAQREQLPYLTLHKEETVKVWGPFAEPSEIRGAPPNGRSDTLEALDQVIANYHEQLDDPNRPLAQEGLAIPLHHGEWRPNFRPRHQPGQGPDPNDHINVLAPLESNPLPNNSDTSPTPGAPPTTRSPTSSTSTPGPRPRRTTPRPSASPLCVTVKDLFDEPTASPSFATAV